MLESAAGTRTSALTAFPTVRVAAIQATPAILDAEACIEKAARLLGEAADRGAQLAVLPECFVPLYPSNAWARAAAGSRAATNSGSGSGRTRSTSPGRCSTASSRSAASAISSARSASTSASRSAPARSTTRSPTSGRAGLLGRHRKLMPTQHERLFHGVGAGDDLATVEAAGARVGGLICWENHMPLARYAVYRGGPQIWVAPTADDSDGWLASMRHIAIESGAYVVSVPQFIPASAFPADFPIELPAGKDVFGRGGAAIVEPTGGEVIAGPLYGEEGNRVRRLRPSPWPAREALVRLGRALQPRRRAAARARADRRSRPRELALPCRLAPPAGPLRHPTARRPSRGAVPARPPMIDADGPRLHRADGHVLPRDRRRRRPSACSYKGGEPGFVRVLDERTLAFPNYDGNGMYLSMGNVLENPPSGCCSSTSSRNGRRACGSTASPDRRADELPASTPERSSSSASRATQVFPNCPRYIHRMALVEHSRFVPRPGRETPVPDWKRADWACDALPIDDPAREQQDRAFPERRSP